MKRTNLVLDEELLETATRLFGSKTYSSAVNRALSEAIRIAKIRDLAEFFGTSVWAGDLSEMRGDHPADRSNAKESRKKAKK